jgi:hypothetical protein
MTLEDFELLSKRGKAPNLAELPTRDFVRNGLSKDQACQMFRAGFLDVLEAEGFVTGPIKEQAWHSETSDVYHDSPQCQTGDNISARNVIVGKGGKRRCEECARVTGERRKGRRK